MNQEQINRDLATKTAAESEFQKKVLQHCKRLINASAEKMSDYHSSWDNNDFIYRGFRLLDKNDKEAVAAKEPPKIVVPITFAQIQTAVSFLYSSFTQRQNFYELSAIGPEDESVRLGLETDLNYQLGRQKFNFKLYCFLLDVFKYGFGVIKTDWATESSFVRAGRRVEKTPLFGSLLGFLGQSQEKQFDIVEEVRKVTSYEGNRFTNISPYAFYPDPSVTLSNFQDGKFVAHDEETSLSAIKKFEGDLYFGTDKIPQKLADEDVKDRRRRSGAGGTSDRSGLVPGAGEKEGKSPQVCVRTEIQLALTRSEAKELFDYDVKNDLGLNRFLVVIANDAKVIKFQPLGYLHDSYTYCLSEYSPDHNAFYNPGLADTIYELQNLITFFLNSHVVNVRKIIQNRFIGDETKINMDDIRTGAMFIRTKNSGIPLDRVMKQLETFDVTSHHVQDMDTLVKLTQIVTGVNDNALGQYSEGRRSATEARNVNAGAAARLKMHGSLIWMQGLEPLGRQVLSNTRQARSKLVYDQIVGNLAVQAPWERTILASPDSIAGGFDFVPFDAMLPSDNAFKAGKMTEIFTLLANNPENIQLLNINPVKLLDHIAKLYGIRNLEDFALVAPQVAAGVPPTASVVPDEVAAEAAGQGAQPVDIGGSSLLRNLAQ